MLKSVILTMIRFYRTAISPFTPPSCRFTPTCSGYALEAIERFGPWRGGWLFLRRFARCHPFGGKGYDPVPPSLDRPGTRTRPTGAPEAEPVAREGRPA